MSTPNHGLVLVLIEGDDEERPVVRGLGAAPLPGPHHPYKAVLPDGTQVVVCTTGVGPDRAHKVSVEAIATYQPTLVVSAGTCGGLTPAMEMNDWLCTTTVRFLSDRQNGRQEIETLTSPVPKETMQALLTALSDDRDAPRAHDGLLVTVAGEPIIERCEKEVIAGAHDAMAVDMESYGIAKASHEAGLPWLVARVVVDTPDIPLPELGHLNVATGRPALPKIFSYVLRRPVRGPYTLYGLWKLVQIYSRHLVRVLTRLRPPAEVRVES
jgi:nucleoside phosphorylase